MATVFIMTDEGDDIKIYEAHECHKKAYYEFGSSNLFEKNFNDHDNTFSLTFFSEKHPSIYILFQNNTYSYLSNNLENLQQYKGFLKRCFYEK